MPSTGGNRRFTTGNFRGGCGGSTIGFQDRAISRSGKMMCWGLTTPHGVRWHIIDPWAAHQPDFESGEEMPSYVSRLMTDLQQSAVRSNQAATPLRRPASQ